MSDESKAFRAALAKNGLSVTAEFIPFSKSRNAKPRNGNPKPWRSLNWRVTLTKYGSPILTTDYSAGEAHAPAYKALKPGQRDKMYWQPCIDSELENGFEVSTTEGSFFGRPKMPRKPILPDDSDVWASILSDSRSVLDSGDFETWARDLGYDTDSRNAESIFKACTEHALKLVSAIGPGGVLDSLTELAGQL